MRDPYYTDEDIESVINDLENETENSMKVALKTVLIMLKQIKDSHENCMGYTRRKVHTQPTDNREDIIVGQSHKPGMIYDVELHKCNCPICKSGK